MSVFVSTFDLVAPLFFIVLVGFAARRFGVLQESAAPRLNGLCYRVLIPCSMFCSSLGMRLERDSLWFGLFVFTLLLVSAAVLTAAVPRFVPDRRQAGAVVQASFRSNISIIGPGLMAGVCGEAHMAPMVIAIAAATLSCNISVPILLTYFAEGGAQGRLSPGRILADFLRNPLVVGTALGIAVGRIGWELPAAVMEPVRSLAACAAPIAMLSAGLRLDFSSLSGSRRAIAASTFLKLVAMPLVWAFVAAALGFGGDEIAAIVIGLGAMAGSIVPAVAEAFGCDGKLSSDILIVQTVGSMFTLFLGILALRMLHIVA